MKQKLMCQLVLNFIWNLIEYLQVIIIYDCRIFIVFPFVVEVWFDLAFKLKFNGFIVVELLKDAKELT